MTIDAAVGLRPEGGARRAPWSADMMLVVTINGREAIPVRALPWATRWYFGAAEVVEALAGDLQDDGFPVVAAYWWEGGQARAIEPSFWANIVAGNVDSAMQEFADREQRLIEATRRLPAEAVVWRDEWEAAYADSLDGPGSLAKLAEEDPKLAGDVAERLLDLRGPVSQDVWAIVMEAFQTPGGRAKAGAGTGVDARPAAATRAASEVAMAGGIGESAAAQGVRGDGAKSDGTRPLQRLQAQEEAILGFLRHDGHDPMRLPKNAGGRAGGLKAKVRKRALKERYDLFTRESFDKAWQRLRDRGEIADDPSAEEPRTETSSAKVAKV